MSIDVAHDPTVMGDDLRWYWAAPLLLDRLEDAAPWMGHQRNYRMSWVGGAGADDEDGEATSHEIFNEHIGLASAMYRGDVPLGRKPDDLPDVLVDIALGSPATVALRSIGHTLGDRMPEPHQWDGACRIGWAFRSLFNLPDVNSLIRSAHWDQEYWRTAVQYCADDCLTAVLDEYLHVLRESVGLYEINADDPLADMHELASAVQEAVSIRTTPLAARDHLGEADTTPRFRTRYAMRFGNDRSETESSTTTATHLRRAFNSPFWPFVLTSTSVGQEGLDFHLYCHAIMHWNLPTNPVDLEQREGRVHRYKGHAVRRNLAEAMADAAWASDDDPWEAMFDSAADARAESDNELVPYWIYPAPPRSNATYPCSRSRANKANSPDSNETSPDTGSSSDNRAKTTCSPTSAKSTPTSSQNSASTCHRRAPMATSAEAWTTASKDPRLPPCSAGLMGCASASPMTKPSACSSLLPATSARVSIRTI